MFNKLIRHTIITLTTKKFKEKAVWAKICAKVCMSIIIGIHHQVSGGLNMCISIAVVERTLSLR